MKRNLLALSLMSLLGLMNVAGAAQCNLSQGLNEKQLKVLKSADRIKRVFLNKLILGKEVYDVVVLNNSKKNQFIAILGETHIKGPRSSVLGKKVVNQFHVRMVEGVPKAESEYIAKNLTELDATIGWKRALLQYLTFNPFGSTITASEKDGYTFLPGYDAVLHNKKKFARVPTTSTEDVVSAITSDMINSGESLNLPMESGAFITPTMGDDYILTARNKRMAQNITYYIDQEVVKGTPVVVVGAAHLPGLSNLLEYKGYQRCFNF